MSFDPDAADYFSRVAGVGGDFASSLYTATTTQNAINEWFVASRDFGFYSKIAEAYLFVGPTFPGLFAKLKHAGVATLTNVDFVAGDLVQAGVGAGLKGNGQNNLETSVAANAWSSLDKSLSAYATEAEGSGSRQLIQAFKNAQISTFLGRAAGGGSEQAEFAGGSATRPGLTIAARNGFFAATCVAPDSRRLFRNGEVIGSNSGTTTDAAGPETLKVFGDHNQKSFARIAFGHIGYGMNDAEVTDLSTTTNAILTRLGANVYGPVAPPAAALRRKHAAAHFFTSRF